MRAITRTDEVIKSGERVVLGLDLEDLEFETSEKVDIFPHIESIRERLWVVDFDIKGKKELFAIVENKSHETIILDKGTAVLECIPL